MAEQRPARPRKVLVDPLDRYWEQTLAILRPHWGRVGQVPLRTLQMVSSSVEILKGQLARVSAVFELADFHSMQMLVHLYSERSLEGQTLEATS